MGGAAAVLLREWIFLHVMIGGSRGVAGPKELMGLVGTVTVRRAYSPPTPRSVDVDAQCFATCPNFVDDDILDDDTFGK